MLIRRCSGGGLWHTWFDRDLSLAGRVMVKTKDGEFHSKLIDLHAPSMLLRQAQSRSFEERFG